MTKDYITKVPKDSTTVMDLARVNNYIHTPSVVIRNNFNVPLWYSNCPVGDYPLYLIVAQKGKIKHLNETMAVYRFGVGMHSNLSGYEKLRVSFLLLLELSKNYPDGNIKEILTNRLRNTVNCFLQKYYWTQEVADDDINMVLSKYYELFEKPYLLFLNDMRNRNKPSYYYGIKYFLKKMGSKLGLVKY
jgi:hypothetical protein